MIMYLFSLVTNCIAAFSYAQTTNLTGPDLASVGQPEALARSYGYVADSHDVITTDGYNLTVFRIQNATSLDRNLKPIVLQHGMGLNSGEWVLLGPQDSLPFILADRGFDVWLSNTRGTLHSRKHQTLSPDSSEFWDYSFHEIGVFDMPATIDLILNATSHKQLYYVGHSMGGTLFYVMNSMRPEYNKKIRQMFGLAPAGYMSNSVLRFFTTPAQLRLIEILGKTLLKNHIESDFILEKLTKSVLCKEVKFECGLHKAMPIPDFISVRQYIHFAQLTLLPNTFRMYDYGTKNMAKYHVPEPPRYFIQRITAPMTIMYSTGDNLASWKDMERFAQDVPSAQLYKISNPSFGHIHFTASSRAKDLVYDPMIKKIINF